MKTLKHSQNGRRGAALVEYGLIVAGVALVAAAAVSVFGQKTAQMIGSSAAILPGATAEDNGPIVTGQAIKTKQGADGIVIDAANQGTINENLGLDDVELVTEPSAGGGGG